MTAEPNYEGFIKHIKTWDKMGAVYGKEDIEALAKMYNTPLPKEEPVNDTETKIEGDQPSS